MSYVVFGSKCPKNSTYVEINMSKQERKCHHIIYRTISLVEVNYSLLTSTYNVSLHRNCLASDKLHKLLLFECTMVPEFSPMFAILTKT